MRDRKGVDPSRSGDGKELGGVEGLDIIIGIYYVRKASIFNKRNNSNIHLNFFSSGKVAQYAHIRTTHINGVLYISIRQ